ncbi:lysosomal cystine transporter [Phlyctema vagabunda]|uniref:Lysosomal cystine transporter n=1 Tax=Phlyctema vagabunda TaxID=108571 RepID=A0ABR4PJB2_9HELO
MTFTFLESISLCFGLVYTFCWSASFYPQPLLNLRRKSTSGVNIDFPAVNVLGFAAYLVSCSLYRYSPTIRYQYSLRNEGVEPLVALNDVLFAGHAVVLAIIILSQFLFPSIWKFDKRSKRGPGASVSWAMLGVMLGCFSYVAISIILVWREQDSDPKTGWAYIDVVSAIATVKLIITFIKYIPQVITNWQNQSTRGWSIFQILLDFTGGVLSNAQLLLDAYNQGDISNITGNPVKLGLGNVSIMFDIIFIIQHYCLYASSRQKEAEGEYDPLLEGHREDRID